MEKEAVWSHHTVILHNSPRVVSTLSLLIRAICSESNGCHLLSSLVTFVTVIISKLSVVVQGRQEQRLLRKGPLRGFGITHEMLNALKCSSTFFKTRSHCVALTGLKLLCWITMLPGLVWSSQRPVCPRCLPSAGIKCVCTHTCCILKNIFFKRIFGKVSTGEKAKYNLKSF